MAKGAFHVTIVRYNKLLGGLSEKWNHFFIDFLEHGDCAQTSGFDNLFWLRNSNLLHGDSSLLFDMLKHHFVFVAVESDASA